MTDKPQDTVNRTGGAIAIGLTLLLGVICVGLMFVEIPPENKELLLMVATAVTTLLGACVNWYFGSSSQAKKQADTIDTLAKTAQATTAPDGGSTSGNPKPDARSTP